MNTEAVIDYITNWLEDYARQAKVNGFTLGISGGIDSAVVSVLCARTGLNTLCLQMPIHQASSEVGRADRHIAMLHEKYPNVESRVQDLTGVYDAFAATLPGRAPSTELSLANLRARLRMTALYYYAGEKGLLVAGTGNKVEDFGVGFFTKYGDGGVDISPIADLMKSEVYALAKELEVGDDILGAPPTDGLWGDERTDEDQLGASYPELEWAMTFEGDPSGLTDRQREVLGIYRDHHNKNLHKFRPVPVCEIPPGLKE